MIAARYRRSSARRRRAGSLAAVLRIAAVALALIGMLASALITRGWQGTVTRQRDERLDRTAASRTATIGNALRHYENALQATRSLLLASDSVGPRDFGTFARTLGLKHRYPGLQGDQLADGGPRRQGGRVRGRRP